MCEKKRVQEFRLRRNKKLFPWRNKGTWIDE